MSMTSMQQRYGGVPSRIIKAIGGRIHQYKLDYTGLYHGPADPINALCMPFASWLQG